MKKENLSNNFLAFKILSDHPNLAFLDKIYFFSAGVCVCVLGGAISLDKHEELYENLEFHNLINYLLLLENICSAASFTVVNKSEYGIIHYYSIIIIIIILIKINK